MLTELIIRFVLGGIVVSTFAVLGDLLTPKSFAGLFGAAPSVAIVTVALTIAKEGTGYASLEGRSMIFGAIALGIYAQIVSWLMVHSRVNTVAVTLVSIVMWLGVALGLWAMVLR